MAPITGSLIAELRARSDAPVMLCKKALVEANGDIEIALANLRKIKTGNIPTKRAAAEGIITAGFADDYGVILEVHCETDFIAQETSFVAFVTRLRDFAISNRISDIEALKAQFENEISEVQAKCGGGITISRIAVLTGAELGEYNHGHRVSVLVSTKGASPALSRQLAIHIASFKPQYINASDIPAKVIARERQARMDAAMKSGKSEAVAMKMAEEHVNEFTNNMSLMNQDFVLAPGV